MPDTGASNSTRHPQLTHLQPERLRHKGRSHLGQFSDSFFMTIPFNQAQPCRLAKPRACKSFIDGIEADYRNDFIDDAGS